MDYMKIKKFFNKIYNIMKTIFLLDTKVYEMEESLRNLRGETDSLAERLRNLNDISMSLFHEKHEMILEDRKEIDSLAERLRNLNDISMSLFHEKHEMILEDRKEIDSLAERLRNLNDISMSLFHEKHEMILKDRRELNYILSRLIILYYENCKNISEEKTSILGYLRKNTLFMYPYNFLSKYLKKEVSIYESENLKYLYIKDHGKNLYFDRDFFNFQDTKDYYNFLTMEQDYRSPHCYFNDGYKFIEDYIFIDVGAAEGLISLRLINRAKHIFLIENDIKWINSLRTTFKDYEDKVTLYNKTCSSHEGSSTMKLSEIIEKDKKYFIKIDVEGNEMDVLKSINFDNLSKESKLIVCTYHNQNDYDIISSFFNDIGLKYISSKGYVLSDWGGYKEPYFRKALIKTI
jgi:hypothetical protein